MPGGHRQIRQKNQMIHRLDWWFDGMILFSGVWREDILDQVLIRNLNRIDVRMHPRNPSTFD